MTAADALDPDDEPHGDSLSEDSFPDALFHHAFRRRPDTEDSATTLGIGKNAGDDAPPPDDAHRYVLGEELGRGGMGRVLEAEDLWMGRSVAVKLLHQHHRGSHAKRTRFVEEARIAGRLQHPGIVPVYDLSRVEGDDPFFTMRLLTGPTLAGLLSEREDPLDQRHRLLTVHLRVCEAVAYAHDRGVLHRDLKPSNVMVGPFGETYVMDWGLAKVLSEDGDGDIARSASDLPGADGLSSPGAVLGTPAYMAPEQARGDLARTDRRTDVFALGAIMLEILTGAPPYRSDTGRSALSLAEEASLAEVVKTLSRSAVPDDLERLVVDCLQPEPGARPDDASRVAARLSAYLAAVQERTQAAETAAAVARARAEQEQRARRVTLVLASAIVATVLAAVGAFVVLGSREERRLLNTRRVVSVAESEAREIRARARLSDAPLPLWTAAERAAEKAAALAESGAADTDVIEGARALKRSIGDEAERVRAHIEEDLRHRGIIERLTEQRALLVEHQEPPRAKAAFAKIFAELALDPDDMPAARIRAREVARAPRAREFGLALDFWSSLTRKGVVPSTTSMKLEELASLIDPDPRRVALRSALANQDVAPFRAYARSEDFQDADPISIQLVAFALRELSGPEEAVAALERVAHRHEGDVWLHAHLGTWLNEIATPRPELGMGHLFGAMVLAPQSLILRLSVGSQLRKLGALEDALRQMRLSVERRPDSATARHQLGVTLDALDRTDEARAAFRAALALDPETTYSLTSLGAMELRLGNLDAAEEALRAALEHDDQRAVHHTNLAALLTRRGLVAEARRHFKEALRLEPSYQHALRGLGKSYTASQPEEARSYLEKALAIDPNDADALYSLGGVAAQEGDLDEATDLFRRTLTYRPDHVRARANLGQVLKHRGRLHEAVHELELANAENQRVLDSGAPTGAFLASAREAVKNESLMHAVLAGLRRPADAAESLRLIEHAQSTSATEFASVLWNPLISVPPGSPTNLLRAARDAAIASQGIRTRQPMDSSTRRALRRDAQARLRELVDLYEEGAEKPSHRKEIAAALRKLLVDAPFRPFRGSALAGLPGDEAEAWRDLWRDARALLADLANA